MKNSIVAKINNQILNKVDSEIKALYILVQSRKLLEIIDNHGSKDDYPTVSLICDWVLHSKLSRKGAKSKLEEYASFFENQSNGGMFEFMESGFTLFSDFKQELIQLYSKLNINQSLLKNRKEWLDFVKVTIEILKDIPLEGKGKILKFTFNEGFIVDDRSAISFTIAFKDGGNKSFTLDLEIFD